MDETTNGGDETHALDGAPRLDAASLNETRGLSSGPPPHDGTHTRSGVASSAPGPGARSHRARVGTTIGRFVVLGILGEGGMGTVYEAFDRTLDRRVAVKVLRRDTSSQARRLVREAKALAQLSHPNVVQVYEVGEVADQTFVAMELVQGHTLKQWIRRAPRPSWRQCVEIYAQAGAGLAAAHERDLVHRDFKPSNAVVDDKGRVRVLDFGLARIADEPRPLGRSETTPPPARAVEHHPATGVDTQVTESGLVMGTPGYMPLEQMCEQDVDARSDQFSFCVALYEAVYGERPYRGHSIPVLMTYMREEELAPAREDCDAPPELREVLVRGLAATPEQRWPSMEALLERLDRLVRPQRDRLELAAAEWNRLGRPRAALWSAVQLAEIPEPDRLRLHPREAEFFAASEHAVARARLLRRVAVVALPVVLAITYGLLRLQAHAELQSRIDEQVREAEAGLQRAQRGIDGFLEARASAFDQFDAGQDAPAREAWTSALAKARLADLELSAAARRLEGALPLDPSRRDARSRLADALLLRAELAEHRRDGARVDELIERLALYDTDGERVARWNRPATLSIETTPAGARLELAEYRSDELGRRTLSEPGSLGTAPLREHTLARGSYQLRAEVPGRPPVVLPLVLERAEALEITLELPPAEAIPPGFVYVPAGRFLHGSADETLFDAFYDSVPIHQVWTESYLIARYEVTFGEWIEFLDSLPPAERGELSPRLEQSYVPVTLGQDATGTWELVFPRERREARAAAGEPLSFVDRDRRVSQDWLRMPVVAISFVDAAAYLRWLDESGRVPGARVCDDWEWERAARGADDRLYPHGDHLEPDDANIDVTYGRTPSTAGPDEVGSHPTSRSPYGIDDIIGNAGEWTSDRRHPGGAVLRGSSFFLDAISAHVVMRAPVAPEFADGVVGMRVCAPYPLPRPVGTPRP